METRYIQRLAQEDLKSRVVFIAEPQQSGKTTIAHEILRDAEKGAYFNLKRGYSKARLDVIFPMERFGGLLSPGKGKLIGNNR